MTHRRWNGLVVLVTAALCLAACGQDDLTLAEKREIELGGRRTDLAVVIDGPQTVRPGDEVVVHVTAFNYGVGDGSGSNPAADALIDIPPGWDVTNLDWQYESEGVLREFCKVEADTAKVNCSLGGLLSAVPPYQMWVTYRIPDPTPAGTVDLGVVVRDPIFEPVETDPDPTDNTATLTITIQP